MQHLRGHIISPEPQIRLCYSINNLVKKRSATELISKVPEYFFLGKIINYSITELKHTKVSS